VFRNKVGAPLDCNKFGVRAISRTLRIFQIFLLASPRCFGVSAIRETTKGSASDDFAIWRFGDFRPFSSVFETLISSIAKASIRACDDLKATMKFCMTKVLRFWVDCEYQHIKHETVGPTKTQLVAEILHKFEEAGDAMQYLNADGKMAWKATPEMLTRLADAEQEVLDDWEE
jgi:hypothetical protein